MAFNFNQVGYQDPNGISWNFDTPWYQQQSQLSAANNPSGMSSFAPVQQQYLGEDFYKQLGFTGQAGIAPTLSDAVSGGNDQWKLTPELTSWLQDKGYTYGSGMAGSTPYRGYFDPEGNVVGGLQKGASDAGAFGEFIRNAVGLYLGGTALGGALQGAGAGAGAGAADLGYLEAADAAGGLLPEFGTTAAYNGALGNAAAAGGLADLGGAMGPPAELAGEGLMGPPESLAGIPETTGGSMNGIPGTPKGTLPTTPIGQIGSDLGSLLTSNNGLNLGNLLGLINANNQRNEWDKMMSSLDSMYSPDSPYAKQMEETLARKDSAAGRNSQYGPRAADLAAKLTEAKANTFKDMAALKTNAFGAQNAGVGSLANIFGDPTNKDALKQIFSGLGDGWDELLKLLGD